MKRGEKALEAIRDDLWYVSTENGDTYGPYEDSGTAEDDADRYPLEIETAVDAGSRVREEIWDVSRFELRTPEELRRILR